MDFSIQECILAEYVVGDFTVKTENRYDSLTVYFMNNVNGKAYCRIFANDDVTKLKEVRKSFPQLKTIRIVSDNTAKLELHVENPFFVGEWTIFPYNKETFDKMQKDIDNYLLANDICKTYTNSVFSKTNYQNNKLNFKTANENPIEQMNKHFEQAYEINGSWSRHPIMYKLQNIILILEKSLTAIINTIFVRLQCKTVEIEKQILKLDKTLPINELKQQMKTIIFDKFKTDYSLKTTSVDVFKINDMCLCWIDHDCVGKFNVEDDMNIDEFIEQFLPKPTIEFKKYAKLFAFPTNNDAIYAYLKTVNANFTEENIKKVFYDSDKHTIDLTVADTPEKKFVVEELDKKLVEFDFLQATK